MQTEDIRLLICNVDILPLQQRNCLWLCSYKAGDVLMVEPHNMPDTVSSFIELLHLNPDALVTLNTTSDDDSESSSSMLSPLSYQEINQEINL